jgi:polyvinyl alcohol dehydrogenase (cytochrome)
MNRFAFRAQQPRLRPVLALFSLLVLAVVAAFASSAAGASAGATPGSGPVASASREAGVPPGARPGDWAEWQHGSQGGRNQPFERQITPATVKNLKLKWSFVFPNQTGVVWSQPAVVGDTLYVGGPDSRFYALNARTGATKWSFDLRPHAGSVPPPSSNQFTQNPVKDGPAVVGDTVFFGDGRANVFALNRHTGRMRWMTKIDTHSNAILSGSPTYFDGRIFIGVSSTEYAIAADDRYPCCTFSGKMVALDTRTGKISWTYRTMPQPKQDGTWPGTTTPRWISSGGSVWSTPVIDPRTRTIYFGAGNNYSGSEGHSDSAIALNLDTGTERWTYQLTHPDAWTVRCVTGQPPGGSCPGLGDDVADELDYDVGSPLMFQIHGRPVVGFTQKSGVYHVFDARTGKIVWQTQLSVGAPNQPWRGIEWGASYDGHQLYVATWRAYPGTLHALNPDTGAINWKTPLPADACTTGGAAHPIKITPPDDPPVCTAGNVAAVSSSPGLVYEGAEDGKMRIYSAKTGENLWTYDSVHMFTGVNGLSGPGGSISGNGGAVVSHGMVYVESGYQLSHGLPGHVLLAFGL